MSDFVLPLSAVGRGDVAQVGAKAAQLGMLRAEGFPVPAGFCVTTRAWNQVLGLARARLDTVVTAHERRSAAGAHAAAAVLAPLLAGLAIPPEVSRAVEEALATLELGSGAVAVRSSTRAEDSATASFAGQYATVLGVRDLPAVLDALLTCWRSFFSATALAARAAAGAVARDDAMAVLVQRVVEAECAGVCLTVDPIHRRRDGVVINAAWGLGVGVVDGSVAADTLRLRRMTLTPDERLVVDKTEQWGLDPAGGVRRVPVPVERRRAACLPRRWGERVAQMSLAAEWLFGQAQDVEWAIADRQIWLLQSRPVTGLDPALARVPSFPVEWESDGERRRPWMLLPSAREELPPPLQQDYDVAAIGSWTDASLLNGGVRFAPLRMCHGRGYTVPTDDDLHDGDRRVRAAALTDLATRLREAGVTFWDYWGPEVVAAVAHMRAFLHTVDRAEDATLAEKIEDAFGLLRRHWGVHALLAQGEDLLLAPYYAAYAAVAGRGGDAARTEATALLVGEDTAFSALVDGLARLAALAQAEPEVAAVVVACPPAALDRLAAQPAAAAFRAAFAAFLADYGERTGTGYGSRTDLATPTWHEDPLLVLRCLAPYLDPAAASPHVARARVRRTQAARVAALCAACPEAEPVATLRRWWPYACRVAAWLEDHNHYIDQASYGQLRLLLLAAGRRLAHRGALAAPDDVFWLRRAEISSALRTVPPSVPADTVATRKAQHARWATLEAPPVMGTPAAALPPRPPLVDDLTLPAGGTDGRLAGQAASPGQRRGRARVIAATTPLPALLPGEVLVAENAGPLWTPLFPLLGGLILEQGAVTQHAATIAREYGVPAVLGVESATQRIPEGAWVTVDGDSGTVEVERDVDRAVPRGTTLP